MQNTENYNLPIIEGTDVISMVPHNQSVEIIDENMKRIDDGLTVQTERVDGVVETVETTLEQTVENINETLEQTKEEIESEVDSTLASAINVSPIVAGNECVCDVAGVPQFVSCGYHNPVALPINKQRKLWSIMRPASDEHGDYFASVPIAPNANPTISIIKEGIYKVDIDFTVEFTGIGDGCSAMVSLVKNASISGGEVSGTYLKSKYFDLNGDGKQTIHLTAYVKQDTDTPIIITPICNISGGGGTYDIIIGDDDTISTTITKIN